MRRQIFSLLVRNNTGLLSRVSGLFSRRGYSIDSLTVGTTMDERYSRLTVVARGDEQILQQIEKQLEKLEDVIDIKILAEGESVCRELILLKIRCNPTQRAEIISLVEIFRVKIVGVELDSLMLEMTGSQSKVDAFLRLLEGYDVLELARTGLTGLSRGTADVVNPEE